MNVPRPAPLAPPAAAAAQASDVGSPRDSGLVVVAALDSAGVPRSGYFYFEELPEAVVRVPSVYPPSAREAGVQGTVMVQALVGTDGHVHDVRIVHSIPMLDDAAKAAVMQWKFKPARSAGKPVAAWVGVPIKFSLP
jgi:protein TonB